MTKYFLQVKRDSRMPYLWLQCLAEAHGMQLATIGYERAALADFIETLIGANVKRVIDVREIAQSRRPGFSKGALIAALAAVDIDYYHVRQLGDPKAGREAARAGQIDLFKEIFVAHMELRASQQAISDVTLLVTEKMSALMCFERDPLHCHRTIVAERIARLASLRIANLSVETRRQGGIGCHAVPTDRLA